MEFYSNFSGSSPTTATATCRTRGHLAFCVPRGIQLLRNPLPAQVTSHPMGARHAARTTQSESRSSRPSCVKQSTASTSLQRFRCRSRARLARAGARWSSVGAIPRLMAEAFSPGRRRRTPAALSPDPANQLGASRQTLRWRTRCHGLASVGLVYPPLVPGAATVASRPGQTFGSLPRSCRTPSFPPRLG